MTKPIISFALIAFAGAAAVAAGCSAADPGVEYLGSRHLDGTGGGDAGTTSTSTTTGTGTTGNTGTTTTTEDGGTTTATGNTDSGTPAAGGDGGTTSTGDAGTPTPFTGLTAYASKPVAMSARTNHANNNVAAQTTTLDCLGCHVTGGAGVPFLAAGWVASAANGTTGAADVEVGVYSTGTSSAYSAHTDTDGFFWINPPNGGAAGPYYGGVRQATEVDMPTTQAVSDCNSASCHGGATPGPLHYP
jgi:hypothetical protein